MKHGESPQANPIKESCKMSCRLANLDRISVARPSSPSFEVALAGLRKCGAWALAPLALVASASVCAQTSYLDQAETFALGAKYQSFRVPTTDASGNVGYWDVNVQITVDATGKPSSTASVVATKSPKFKGNKVIGGSYLDPSGDACTVTAVIANSGRQHGLVSCTGGMSANISADWFNGPLVGNFYEAELEAAGIDKLSDWQDFAWGEVGYTYLNEKAWTCFQTPGIVSASQVGTKLSLSFFGSSNVPICSMTLTLQTT
ncbi:MAG TPA: hypothetical protein VH328_07895 [Burkholderiaceae bacterium]|nr:hypothetical protein [Burkholderiaceae bacterium]